MSRSLLADGVLYGHWTDVLHLTWPYPNFTPLELASKREGEFYWHKRSFDALQLSRKILGLPMYINSAHRSWLHNIAVGGAPLSAHRYIAFDISLAGFEKMLAVLYRVLKSVGFRGFGFYRTFIHVDLSKARMWFGSDQARSMWAPVLSSPAADILL